MWSGGVFGTHGGWCTGATSRWGVVLAGTSCLALGNSRVGVLLTEGGTVAAGAMRLGAAGIVAAGAVGWRRLATHAAMRRSVSGGSWKNDRPKRLRPDEVVPWTRATNASGSTQLEVSSSGASGNRTRTNSLSLNSPLISTPMPPSLMSTTSAATSPTRVERTARTRCGTRADARRSELGWGRRAMQQVVTFARVGVTTTLRSATIRPTRPTSSYPRKAALHAFLQPRDGCEA